MQTGHTRPGAIPAIVRSAPPIIPICLGYSPPRVKTDGDSPWRWMRLYSARPFDDAWRQTTVDGPGQATRRIHEWFKWGAAILAAIESSSVDRAQRDPKLK